MAAAEPAAAQADQLDPKVEDKDTLLARIASVRLSCDTGLSTFYLPVPLRVRSHHWAPRNCEVPTSKSPLKYVDETSLFTLRLAGVEMYHPVVAPRVIHTRNL